MNYDRRMRLFFPIPDEVAKATKRLKDAGFEAYLVGGCVRDLFLGRKPVDWDVTTNATPEEIMSCHFKILFTQTISARSASCQRRRMNP